MSGRVGSITTDIIADGLIFNMDAANRASTIPSTSTTETFNTVDLSQSGSFENDNFFDSSTISPSFAFDGTEDYIETTKTSAYTAASLSMWIKVSGNFGVNERQSLSSNDDYNHSRDFIIADSPTTTNDAYIAMFAGAIIYGQTSASGGIVVNDGNWHNLVWTYDGSAGSSAAINLYVDGQNQYSNSSYSSYWSYEIKFQYFGKPVAANAYFGGNIANSLIYNRALSANEVLHNYNALKGRFGL